MLLMTVKDLVRRHLGVDVRRVHVRRGPGPGTAGSNFDEQDVIDAHLAAHPPASRFFVDIGAADGEVSSNTAHLVRGGWQGLSLELDGDEFARLARATAAHDGVQLARCRVTPSNVVPLLAAYGAPSEPGFVSLDIDGYDQEVLDALLSAYRPALVCTEINEKVPPPVRFHVHYSDDYAWSSDHFYGHSLATVADMAERHGYALVALEYNNAFLAPREHGVIGLGLEEAYRSGYLDRSDRLKRLPWNKEVDHLHDLAPAEVVTELQTMFAGRAGQFTAYVGPASATA